MAETGSALAPGTPVWVDLSTPDLEAGRGFYEKLFGWTSEVTTDPQAGGYTLFRHDAKLVAGAGPLMNGHAAWNTYIRTADARQTAEKVREAGGEVVLEPMKVLDQGTMAVFRDPTGAYISVWQFDQMTGAELYNVPVSLSWNELSTRDPAAARRFYASVFGWDATGEDKDYVQWQLTGKTIGGMMDLASHGVPEEVPAHWLAYFTVSDADAIAAQTLELGGTVRMPAFDAPGLGRIAVIADPQGAVFGVFASSGGG
jgi:predicted enzyme related to lactoylglutathione lyase